MSNSIPSGIRFNLQFLLLLMLSIPLAIACSRIVTSVSYEAWDPPGEIAKRYLAPFNWVVFFLYFSIEAMPGIHVPRFPGRTILVIASMLCWLWFFYYFSLPKTKLFPNFPHADKLRDKLDFRVIGWLPYYLAAYFILGVAVRFGGRCEFLLDLLLLPVGWLALKKELYFVKHPFLVLLFVVNAVIWCILAEWVASLIRKWHRRKAASDQ